MVLVIRKYDNFSKNYEKDQQYSIWRVEIFNFFVLQLFYIFLSLNHQQNEHENWDNLSDDEVFKEANV